MSLSSTTAERIFLLNIIELAVAVFRGPGPDGWAAIVGSGLPELLAAAPPTAPDLTVSLGKLQDSLPGRSGIAAALPDLESEFVRLFVAGGGGVPVPPYESCHQEGSSGSRGRTMGASALRMRDRLAAAGLAVSLDSNEPPDHLSIELEYLFHLLSTGWAGEDPAAAAEGVSFAAAMTPWVRRFLAGLQGAEAHPAFIRTAETLVGALGRIAEG